MKQLNTNSQSANKITFEVLGQPIAKQRPRMARNGRVYTPSKTVAFERLIRSIAAPHFTAPIRGPVKVTVWATPHGKKKRCLKWPVFEERKANDKD